MCKARKPLGSGMFFDEVQAIISHFNDKGYALDEDTSFPGVLHPRYYECPECGEACVAGKKEDGTTMVICCDHECGWWQKRLPNGTDIKCPE